jgi:hypothetical protein
LIDHRVDAAPLVRAHAHQVEALVHAMPQLVSSEDLGERRLSAQVGRLVAVRHAGRHVDIALHGVEARILFWF